jgi:hypothetical protein
MAVLTGVDTREYWLLCLATLGVWFVISRLMPEEYGIWRCDECGGRAMSRIRGRREAPSECRTSSVRAAGIMHEPLVMSAAAERAMEPKLTKTQKKQRKAARRKAKRRARCSRRSKK